MTCARWPLEALGWDTADSTQALSTSDPADLSLPYGLVPGFQKGLCVVLYYSITGI
jgi:hypothetical protein